MLIYLKLELFCLWLSFFAYSPLRRLWGALSHCKQKAKDVSEKKLQLQVKELRSILSKKLHCKQEASNCITGR